MNENDRLSSSGCCSEADRLLSEIVLVSWLTRQKKDRRRLMIAALDPA
jgi:hypothetical protein